MKAVLYHHRGKEEFLRVFDMVKHLSTIVEYDITKADIDEDSDHIYIVFKSIVYKFNRFDNQLISIVEEAINTSPYPQYEGPLTIINIDNRFTNKKYYTINKRPKFECFQVNKDAIIEDLYNTIQSFNTNTNNYKKFDFDFDF
jgi:hypothetical protein